MNKQDILTRAIELIYMSYGVYADSLMDTKYDAVRVEEMAANDSTTVGTIASLLDIVLMDRFNITEFENTYDDAEFLLNLARL